GARDTVTPRNSTDLAALSLPSLEALLEAQGLPRFRAKQIFQWIWRRGATDFAAMTNIGRDLREQMREQFHIATPAVVRHEHSDDGTQKLVLALADRRQIECVYIPDTPAQTFCISTQVGCAMGCAFCLTGKMGLVRHLSAGEIAGQVRVLAKATGLLDAPFNVVLMGMGEPLHNYDATMQALALINEAEGLAVSPRRVTLSTVGLVPMIDKLASEPLMPNLAISLHATTEEQRASIVPPSRKYGLQAVIDACKRFPVRKRSRITFEYVMLDGVNDTPADARRLVRLLDGVKAKVNLIPLNAAPGIPFDRPSDDRVNAFARVLAARQVTVSVRKSRGRDIRAACGQLIVEGGRAQSAAQALATALA
ncbi:MAG TPA: 23S rRNA (adenine(2503)-C(2))-methyltransferase RlmN, partial [Vicinamibacterales bacterium]|nr:23S rRNA (adenine(2503)-C(2))-methyltransferase RlmN [Vicinamibacterales bacterium]